MYNEDHNPANTVKMMVLSIRTEEAAITAAAIYFLSIHNLALPVWLWIPLFFSPDISMLGYLINPRIGAYCYNLFHHRGIAIAVAAAGFFLHQDLIATTGILLFAHSSFDRMMGYGLKYPDAFTHTHLGWVGKNKAVPGKALSNL